MKIEYVSAEEALEPVRSGQHVLIGSGAAEPQALVAALVGKGQQLSDTEVLHLLTLGTAPYADPRFEALAAGYELILRVPSDFGVDQRKQQCG